MTSPRCRRSTPRPVPSFRVARPEPDSRKLHSSRASWLPPTIGGGSVSVIPGGRAIPDSTQRSSSCRGNSHLPVTLLQGMAPDVTSRVRLRSPSRRYSAASLVVRNSILHLYAYL